MTRVVRKRFPENVMVMALDSTRCRAVGVDLSHRLVPDELREPDAPLLPSYSARPQGVLFTAVVYVLTSGLRLTEPYKVSLARAHLHCTAWAEATEAWRRPHRNVLDGLGAAGELNWTSAIVDAASVRAAQRAR
ncbi:hypothetical protein AB0I84_31820 [Streptomyces spectabilis]|uniref:hypothetical protein n=1 Tax=Streptomyces spectabilis TaxID=68270 RepID=UPI0033F52347